MPHTSPWSVRRVRPENRLRTAYCDIGSAPYSRPMTASKTPLILACIDCGKERTAKARRPGRCPACKKEHERKRAALRRAEGRWTKADPRSRRAYQLLYQYGLTVDQYNELCSGGCCVCGSMDRLSIDHDHACCPTNKTCGKCIRGVLCDQCNVVLGRVKDDPVRLRALADYLEGKTYIVPKRPESQQALPMEDDS